MSDRCLLVMHPDTGRHDTGWGHPEHQGRLPAIVRAIERDTPTLLDSVETREAVPADIPMLARVHPRPYIDAVRQAADEAAAADRTLRMEADTVVSGASWDAAVASAGCATTAVNAVIGKEAGRAFALCRPPGHHATSDRVMGFCLFNNIAVAARQAQAEGVERVLVIDWDVHHGNGTQDIFWEDPSVYYLSLHQYPWYPGTGRRDERGEGKGMNTTRNVTLSAGTDRATYTRVFIDALDATLEECAPDLILVSAGYDCLAGDPLGELLLEPADMHALTRTVIERADALDAGVIAMLEGGYAPERTGQGVVATLRALAGLPAD
jgi:acetoin utilization deacetylase AcuC-like enzyme